MEDQIRREKLRSLKGGETSADEHDLALWISGTLKKYITNLPYKLEYDPGYVSIGATNYLWDKVSAKIQIQEAKYQGGFLKLKGINRSTNQQESYQISLRDFFVMKEGDLFPDDEKLNIMLSSPIQESKKSIDKLKQDLEIESYF